MQTEGSTASLLHLNHTQWISSFLRHPVVHSYITAAGVKPPEIKSVEIFRHCFFANQLRFYIRKCPIIITIKLWPNSLSGHRHTRSWWKNSPDALVSVALRDQPELLQVSESGASDQFALTPLCTWTQ